MYMVSTNGSYSYCFWQLVSFIFYVRKISFYKFMTCSPSDRLIYLFRDKTNTL